MADELFPEKVANYDPADPADAKVLMPEYLTCEDKSRDVAEHVIGWLADPAERDRCVVRLETLKREVANGGASRRAADYMFRELDAIARRRTLRTHFPFVIRMDEAARGAA